MKLTFSRAVLRSRIRPPPTIISSAARAYARDWLETHGHDVAGPIDPHDELLIFVDMVAMMIDLGAVDDLLEKLAGFDGIDRQVELVRQLWRVDSPFTEPVLQALATSVPQVVSKAARKALFSLRSARH